MDRNMLIVHRERTSLRFSTTATIKLKTDCFDHNSSGQQNQQTIPPPCLQENNLHIMFSSSSSSSPSIVEGLDHMRLPFAYKLHLLLCDMETEGNEHVISWVKEGKAFKIHDQKTFETLVQPKYFRQSKIASFIRQCYMYGFSKIERGPNRGSYVHPEFCKDDQEKSLTIQRHSPTRADHKRKNTPPTPLPKRIVNPTPSPTWNTSRMAVFSTIRSDHKQLQQDDRYPGVSSSATSSSQTIPTWQHPSSTTGYLTESTDYKWPVRVSRQLTTLPDSCSIMGPLNALDLGGGGGGVSTHHKQTHNLY